MIATSWLKEGSAAPLVVVTLDLHVGDAPADITLAAEWLTRERIRATFLVQTAMVEQPRYIPRLRELGSLGHEIGTHTHRHDLEEIYALMDGGHSRLGFLERSKLLFEDYFGRSPLAFRSPAWCPLGPAALDELERLGYRVDSSVTPQRLAILSSFPSRGGWMRATRRPHFVRDRLMEVPTSTILVPAAAPAFLTFRRLLSSVLLRMLLKEARWCLHRVVVLQFHVSDFNPVAPPETRKRRALTLGDFVLQRNGGFGFKHLIRETDPARIASMTFELVHLTDSCRRVTLTEAARMVAEGGRARETIPGPSIVGGVPITVGGASLAP